MADETNQNQAGEVAPTTDQPVATDLPTANKPDSKAAAVPPKREKPPALAAAGETPAAAKADAEEKPAAKSAAAKKEKAPAVEDKPFVEFIQQYYLPAVQTAITQQGVSDLQLSFAKQKLSITGFESGEECYQLIGSWQNGLRQFNLYFPDEDIQGKKGFSCNEGKKPSTLESFLIDERKITLDLLVFGLVQRLNGQKWLGRN